MLRASLRVLPVVAAASALVILPHHSSAQANPPLRFTFFSLDRGEATLVQPPEGSPMLIGAGGPGEGPTLIKRLRKRGIKRLDTLMISTWKDQQLGGALDVVKELGVRQLFHNSIYIPGARANAVYSFGQRQEQQRKMVMGSPGPGQSIVIFFTPPCRLTAVAPTGPMINRFAGDPDCSLVMEFSYGRFSMLDLGDTTRKHQQAMWDTTREKPDGEVLVIGHGGATNALLPSLLKPLKTRVAVLPIPRKSGKSPSPETLSHLRKAGVKIYRTDQQGSVTVTTDGRAVSVKTGD